MGTRTGTADASSAEQAPLSGMQADLMANAPGYVQWNIALYEDDVFWILPESHKQPTNEAQRRQLMLDPKVPLEGGIPVELQPGDGIVYPNLMMHWGSKYTSRMRRTIHLGYRSFGGQIFSYHHHLDWYHTDDFRQHLSPRSRGPVRPLDRVLRSRAGPDRNDLPRTNCPRRAKIPHLLGRTAPRRVRPHGKRGAVVPDRQQDRLSAPARDRPDVRARAQAASRRLAARLLRRGHGPALHRGPRPRPCKAAWPRSTSDCSKTRPASTSTIATSPLTSGPQPIRRTLNPGPCAPLTAKCPRALAWTNLWVAGSGYYTDLIPRGSCVT